MSWLREAISDGHHGTASTKRVVMLWAAFILGICTLALTVASFYCVDVVAALTVFGGALGTMAGGGYMVGKWAESKDKQG